MTFLTALILTLITKPADEADFVFTLAVMLTGLNIAL